MSLCRVVRSLRARSFSISQASITSPLKQDTDAAFGSKMEMAGVSPEDRIGIAVFGGVESMALCLLTLAWKRGRSNPASSVGGLTGFALRKSPEEALQIQKWVRSLGIECEKLDGNKEYRYDELEDACRQKNIGFLVVPTDADEQAVQLLVRLSRSIGVHGLAVTPVREIYTQSSVAGSKNLILIKPLIDIYRCNLVDVCKRAGQEWIETPRPWLSKLVSELSELVRLEVLSLMMMYRRQRAELDSSKKKLVSEVLVANKDYGYVVVDRQKLIRVDEEAQLRVLAAGFRFVRPKKQHRIQRTIRKCLQWIHAKPLKGEWLGSGVCCSFQPRSKGSRLLLTASRRIPARNRPEAPESLQDTSISPQAEALENPFDYIKLLREAKEGGAISEATERKLVELCYRINSDRGNSKSPRAFVSVLAEEHADIPGGEDESKETISLLVGETVHHLHKFFISWRQEWSDERRCGSCSLRYETRAVVRLLREEDYVKMKRIVQGELRELSCAGGGKMKEAWEKLRELPVAVQLGLPVVTTESNRLIGVPSVGFQVCPDTRLSSEFRTRVPLTGGNSVWI